MPLTPNGKVDRGTLPAPTKITPRGEAFVAPQTPAEKTLAEIWEGVLRVQPVGILDNFFELGSDSVLGIQVITKANQAGVSVTPRQFFENPRIHALAAVAGTKSSEALEIEQGLVTGPMPLTPIMHWFFEQRLPNPNHFNQAIKLEVRPGVDPSGISEVVEHILWHHDALRLRCMETESGYETFIAESERSIPFVCLDLNRSELKPAPPNDIKVA